MIDFLEFLGVFAFAISGIRHAFFKKLDIFGAFCIGFVTAIGGGTIRDWCLGNTPFWMLNDIYLYSTFAGLLFALLFKDKLVKLDNYFLLFDSIGLGLFVVVGSEKALSLGFNWSAVIIMATITGAFGGVLRDVMTAEIPTVFKQDFYASTCIFGSLIYCILVSSNININLVQVIVATFVIMLRLCAIKYKWQLPIIHNNQ